MAYGEYLLAGLSFANNMLRNFRNGICVGKKGFQKFWIFVILVSFFLFCCCFLWFIGGGVGCLGFFGFLIFLGFFFAASVG